MAKYTRRVPDQWMWRDIWKAYDAINDLTGEYGWTYTASWFRKFLKEAGLDLTNAEWKRFDNAYSTWYRNAGNMSWLKERNWIQKFITNKEYLK